MKQGSAFSQTANAAAYVPRAATDRCLEELEQWASLGDAAVAILAGPSGAGKTLMLRMLSSRTRARFESVYVPNPIFGPREIALWALDSLGTAPDENQEAALLERADDLRREGRGLLLLIDDVELLPTPTEEWLIAKAAEHMRIVLAVSDEDWRDRLEEHAEERGQVISLAGEMSLDETRNFVLTQLDGIGATPAVRAVFDDVALQGIHERAEGIPLQVQNEAAMLLHSSDPADASAGTSDASVSLAQGIVTVGSEFGEPGDAFGPISAPASARENRARKRWIEIAGAFAFGLLVAWFVASFSRPEPQAPDAVAAPETVDLPARSETAPDAPAALPDVSAPRPVAAAPKRQQDAPRPESRTAEPAPATAAAPTITAAAAPSVVPPQEFLVNVNARPWGLVFLNGEQIGETPLAEIPIAPGTHKFEVRLPDGRWIERDIEVTVDNRHLRFE